MRTDRQEALEVVFCWQFPHIRKAGSFAHFFMEALARADRQNRNAIREGFPALVEVFESWEQKGADWLFHAFTGKTRDEWAEERKKFARPKERGNPNDQ